MVFMFPRPPETPLGTPLEAYLADLDQKRLFVNSNDDGIYKAADGPTFSRCWEAPKRYLLGSFFFEDLLGIQFFQVPNRSSKNYNPNPHLG